MRRRLLPVLATLTSVTALLASASVAAGAPVSGASLPAGVPARVVTSAANASATDEQPAPTGVTATASALGVAVAWDAVGEDSGQIEKSLDDGDSWTTITSVATDRSSTVRRQYDDLSGLTPRTIAFYRVRAVSSSSGAGTMSSLPSESVEVRASSQSIVGIRRESDSANVTSLPTQGGDAVTLPAPGKTIGYIPGSVAVSADGRFIVTARIGASGRIEVSRSPLGANAEASPTVLFTRSQGVIEPRLSSDGNMVAWWEDAYSSAYIKRLAWGPVSGGDV